MKNSIFQAYVMEKVFFTEESCVFPLKMSIFAFCEKIRLWINIAKFSFMEDEKKGNILLYQTEDRVSKIENFEKERKKLKPYAT